ncbi:DNA/RNA polymerase [Sparassis latifolia]
MPDNAHTPSDVREPKPSPDSESLVKRLAGPSTTKAGLAKDQSEINRIIAEASKGSKFYENEKRKDKDLTEKIAHILSHRDEVLKGVDLEKVEQGVDHLLVNLEANRDLSHTIVHVDMDAFYASVELLDNPQLKGKAFAVGHGVLTTASYEARKYGVRSGMPAFIAKKLCPHLILVNNRFQQYMTMSKKVMDIFRRYDPNMCVAGCDEGYLSITAYCEEHDVTAEECVQQMRDAVCEETKLTVSAGIAPNKMLAKICSDKNKPNGQFKLEFTPVAIKAFMRDLSIRKVPGVGRVNERLLDSIGIKTCGDIYTHRAVLSLMDKQFGLQFLLQTYLGIASNAVTPGQRQERKSIGAERTFTALSDRTKILSKLEEVAAELEEDMEGNGWTGKTVTLKFKLDTYQVFTRAKSFDRWISTKKEDLYAIGKELLTPELPLTVRLIGLRVTKLKDLRADLDARPGGIKRFFETAATGSSATKKRRTEADTDEVAHDVSPFHTPDGYEDAMPGYHEHEEDDEVILLDSVTCNEAHDINKQRVRPPHSAPASTSATRWKAAKPVSTASATPRDRHHNPAKAARSSSSRPSNRPASIPNNGVHAQMCPVCNKTIETDNQGFNAHIDFCLSKDVIMEAQASTSARTSMQTTSARKKNDGRRNGKMKPG